jgi:hypothetical protein
LKPTRQFGVLRAAGALDDEAGGVLDFWFDQGGRTKLVMLSTENSVGKSLPTSTPLQKSLGQAEAQIALAHEKVERLTAAATSVAGDTLRRGESGNPCPYEPVGAGCSRSDHNKSLVLARAITTARVHRQLRLALR